MQAVLKGKCKAKAVQLTKAVLTAPYLRLIILFTLINWRHVFPADSHQYMCSYFSSNNYLYFHPMIFSFDSRDHISFINEMKVLIQSDELAKDVASAESLLERHQEHKVNVIFTLNSFSLEVFLLTCNSFLVSIRVILMHQRMDLRSLPMMEKNLSIPIIMLLMRSKKRYLIKRFPVFFHTFSSVRVQQQ